VTTWKQFLHLHIRNASSKQGDSMDKFRNTVRIAGIILVFIALLLGYGKLVELAVPCPYELGDYRCR
jgi:hypothetical protein